MISNLEISSLTSADIAGAYEVFEESIKDAFDKEGLGSFKEDIDSQIIYKKQMAAASLKRPDSNIIFLKAKADDRVVGTISYGPCGEDIRKCTNNELDSIGEMGSLYILPGYQGQGIGSALIGAMAAYLSEHGIEQFCLDSGYRRAQKRWLRKFGAPYKSVKDYWGPGSEHMIWLCKVEDFLKSRDMGISKGC